MAESFETFCGRMDHGGCELRVEVEGGRVKSVGPKVGGDWSLGHICPKARALPELLNHPDRLRRPLRRVGARGEGRWEEIGWPEALSLAAEGLNRVKKDFGARAVAFCQGSPKGYEHFVLIRLANTFGSPNVVGPQNVCHMPRETAAMLTCGFFPAADYSHSSEAVLVWGSNLTSTNEEGVICTRLLGSLKKKKAPMIVVDPRRTELARRADIHLALKPGTDLALALGFLHTIIAEELYDRDFVRDFTHGFDQLQAGVESFTPEKTAEICGVDPAALVEAARLFGRARPGLLQWGNGIEQNGYNFDSARALLCLMALGGNLDAPGGNMAPSPPPVMRLGEFVRGDLAPTRAKDMISAPDRPAPGFVVVPPERFKQAVLTGRPYPVRAAYVHVSNPVVAWSDSRETWRALKELDFLVVTETFMSPTAALADLVLPAAAHLEYDDLGHFGLAHGYVLPRPGLVEPPPECRPNPDIIIDLAKALGLGDLWWTDSRAMLADILKPSGLTYDRLAAQGPLCGPVKFFKYRDKGFKTPTGKVELALSRAEKAGLDPVPTWRGPVDEIDDEFPLILTGHKSRNYFCSDHRYLESLRSREPEPLVFLHPETAAGSGVSDGDQVRVETRFGAVEITARVDDEVRPGVLSVVHGWWRPEKGPHHEAGWADVSLNVLTSSRKLSKAMGSPDLRGPAARITVKE